MTAKEKGGMGGAGGFHLVYFTLERPRMDLQAVMSKPSCFPLDATNKNNAFSKNNGKYVDMLTWFL